MKRHLELRIVPLWGRFVVYKCIFRSNYFRDLVCTWWGLFLCEIVAPKNYKGGQLLSLARFLICCRAFHYFAPILKAEFHLRWSSSSGEIAGPNVSTSEDKSLLLSLPKFLICISTLHFLALISFKRQFFVDEIGVRDQNTGRVAVSSLGLKILFLQPFLSLFCTYFRALVTPWWETLMDKSNPQMKAQVELKVTC